MDIKYTLEDIDLVSTEFLKYISNIASSEQALVVGFDGDLGAGKTTLVQSIANQLGVTEPVVSPTFVIAKMYNTESGRFKKLVHIDAYRLESESELIPLGFNNIVSDPNNLVIIEWPERVYQTLSKHKAIYFKIDHLENSRHIHGPYNYEK